MPHGESWFSFLPFYAALQHWVSEHLGPSWPEGSTHLKVQHVIAFAVVVAGLVAVGFVIRRRLRSLEDNIVPEGRLTVFNFIEMIIGSVYNLMVELMGPKPAKYFLPLIGTCALVIFFSNAIGLVPGFLPATDTFNTTLAMALVIFFATHVYGVREHGFLKYFAHFAGPQVPWWIAWLIYPLMFVIETISHLVRPFTLAVRLAANMTADHKVLSIFVGIFAAMTVAGVSLFWFPVPVVFYLMGCLVVTVQTFVFCLLSIIYIALAIQHEEQEEH